MYQNGLVSIVMPCFNNESFVRYAIDSVLDQSFSSWELIIIDDCSTDNTLEVLKSYGDKRINVVASPLNLGAGGARNLAIDKAQGQFIAFLDADDLWAAEKLTLQIDYMIKNRAPISHTSFSFIDFKGNARPGGVIASKKVDLLGHLKNTEIGTSTAIIDRELVGDFSFSLIRARQDLKLWITLLAQGYESYGLDQCLTQYRVSKDSVSSNKIKMVCITFFIYMKIYQIPVAQRIRCYFSYLICAVSKRREIN